VFETLKTLVAPNPAEAAERSAANPLQRLLREKFSIRPIRTLHSVDFGVLWALAIGYESAGALRDLGTLYGPPSEPPCRIRKFGDVRKVVRSVGFRTALCPRVVQLSAVN
jgi:hypothetical protein